MCVKCYSGLERKECWTKDYKQEGLGLKRTLSLPRSICPIYWSGGMETDTQTFAKHLIYVINILLAILLLMRNQTRSCSGTNSVNRKVSPVPNDLISGTCIDEPWKNLFKCYWKMENLWFFWKRCVWTYHDHDTAAWKQCGVKLDEWPIGGGIIATGSWKPVSSNSGR